MAKIQAQSCARKRITLRYRLPQFARFSSHGQRSPVRGQFPLQRAHGQNITDRAYPFHRCASRVLFHPAMPSRSTRVMSRIRAERLGQPSPSTVNKSMQEACRRLLMAQLLLWDWLWHDKLDVRQLRRGRRLHAAHQRPACTYDQSQAVVVIYLALHGVGCRAFLYPVRWAEQLQPKSVRVVEKEAPRLAFESASNSLGQGRGVLRHSNVNCIYPAAVFKRDIHRTTVRRLSCDVTGAARRGAW
jgi:hypothetical protein